MQRAFTYNRCLKQVFFRYHRQNDDYLIVRLPSGSLLLGFSKNKKRVTTNHLVLKVGCPEFLVKSFGFPPRAHQEMKMMPTFGELDRPRNTTVSLWRILICLKRLTFKGKPIFYFGDERARESVDVVFLSVSFMY